MAQGYERRENALDTAVAYRRQSAPSGSGIHHSDHSTAVAHLARRKNPGRKPRPLGNREHTLQKQIADLENGYVTIINLNNMGIVFQYISFRFAKPYLLAAKTISFGAQNITF